MQNQLSTECLQCYQEVVHELFNRWDALKLAVEHIGGRHGHQTAREIKNYIFEYCTQNDNIELSEIREILDEIIDEEFETICEDNSTLELSAQLVHYLQLCIQGRFDEVRQQISQLPKCLNWLDPSFVINRVRDDDDSDSMSDDSSDENEAMDTENDIDAAPLNKDRITMDPLLMKMVG